MSGPLGPDVPEAGGAERIALVSGERRVGHAELLALSRGLATELAARVPGGEGHVVGILAPNGPEFVTAYLAIRAAGRVALPLATHLSPEDLAATLRHARARGIVAHPALWRAVESLWAGDNPIEAALRLVLPPAAAGSFGEWLVTTARSHLEPIGDAAELLYTSGTSGQPKAIIRSVANVRAAVDNAIHAFGYRRDDVIAIVMPLSHSSALTSQLLPVLGVGGTVVTVDRFDPDTVLGVLAAERVTCLRAVPAMLRLLLATPRFRGPFLPALRLVMNSSGPIDSATLEALAARFPAITILDSYGLTEASTCTVLVARGAPGAAGAVGVPVPGVEIRVVDEAGASVPDGSEGELWVRGQHVCARRWLGDRAEPVLEPGGWLRTGDWGSRDPHGRFYLHDRKDDLINTGGYKVMPAEVEACIRELPGVADVAVLGMPHRVLGQIVRAVVVPMRAGLLDRTRIKRHCAERLPSHKVPFVIDLATILPRTPSGKVLRRRIAEELERNGSPV